LERVPSNVVTRSPTDKTVNSIDINCAIDINKRRQHDEKRQQEQNPTTVPPSTQDFHTGRQPDQNN
jgi:hypothetical protein